SPITTLRRTTFCVMYFYFFFCIFFFSSRRRHTRSVSAFLLNRSSDLWLWPVDAKGEPLKATSYMAVGFYVAKYVNKKSDMDLAAKGLGAKEWNNSLKTKLSLLPKKLFRIRMSRNFGMKMRLILIRSEERFSRNAETELVCRLLLEKKKSNNYARTDEIKMNASNVIHHEAVASDN